ncbi:MAG: FlgO family outer membrane protein [Campylobacterota bacterium]|nr:FlgO family outer membrane protein [Campylobacterota bacterium]
MIVKKLKTTMLGLFICCTTTSIAQDNSIELINQNQGLNSTIVGSNGGLDDKIVELADSLLASNKIPQNSMGNIAITSFVNLHQLDQTSYFGRTIAETFFNELFIRGFNVSDFRGQNVLKVNPTGEFYITRDVNSINRKIQNSYVLVGTYSVIDGKILLNARIMDNISGKIVATAKSYYKTNDCKILGTCPKPRMIRIVCNNLKR